MRAIGLCLAIFAVTARAQEKIPVSIETPHGTVTWKELPREKNGKVAAFLREITPDEMLLLRADADQAPPFVRRYASVQTPDSHPLDQLDAAFAGWLSSADLEKEPSERVIRILGAAYGFFCMEHLGVRWAWIKDEFGEDIALVRENPTTRSFPFTSIRYRIEDKKTDFIYALYASLEHLIREAAEKRPAEPGSPSNAG